MRKLNRLIICVGFLFASEAVALPGYISLVPTDQACATCHVDRRGGGVRNAFGAQYESFGFFDRRWPTLCTLDADGDGYTNGEELGDPDCEWRLLTPPPGAISNPSDPTSLPRRDVNDEDEDGADGRAPIPGSQTNAIPGLPANDESDDDDIDDNSPPNEDEENDSMGIAPVPPMADNSNGGTDNELDSSNTDDELSPPGSQAGTNAPGQSQLTPVDPNEGRDEAGPPRAPLGSAQPVNPQSDLELGEANAASGCSTHGHNGTQTWGIPLLACLVLAVRRRRR